MMHRTVQGEAVGGGTVKGGTVIDRSDKGEIAKGKLAQWVDSRLPVLTLSNHLRG